MSVNTTYSLLFNPGNINDEIFSDILDLIIIEKKNGKTSLEHVSLDTYCIKNFLRIKTTSTIALFEFFLDRSLEQVHKQCKQFYYQQRNARNINAIIKKEFYRTIRKKIVELVEYKKLPNLMHYCINPATNNPAYLPCNINTIVPSLFFDVVKTDTDDIDINPMIVIENNTYHYNEFTQNAFVIGLQHNYYLLNIEDYTMLEWLDSIDMNNYVLKPDLLLGHVVKRLELKHTVNRNNCFVMNEIDEIPKAGILISELSEMYLMLTPQWNYDGFLIDGPYQDKVQLTRNGKIYYVNRNAQVENELVAYLRGLHPNFIKQNKGYFYVTFADAKKKNWFLNTYHLLLENNVDIIGIDMLKHFRYSQFAIETLLEIKDEQDEHFVIANLQIRYGKEEIKLIEIQKILLANQKTILLKDDTIGLLPDEWMQQYGTIIKHSKIDKKEIKVPAWIMLSAQQLQDEHASRNKDILYKEEWQKQYELWQKSEQFLYTKPSIIKAELRTYQQKGFEWMALLSKIGAGACLADDMGLGKTLQTITYLAWQYEANQQNNFLIICPASLIYNWKLEIEKFAPTMRIIVLNDVVDFSQKDFKKQNQIYICSYGIARSKTDILQQQLWDVIVLDESHNIKNPNALSTKAVRGLEAKHRIALSGTPVMNNTFDLYSQLHFLCPDILGTPEFFRQQYATPIDREKNEEKVKQLKYITAPFILRRTKNQVAKDLPEKIEQIMWCTMSDVQQAFYDNLKDEIYNTILADISTNGIGKSKIGILAGITKLRQACGAPVLVKDGNGQGVDSIKIQLLIEEIQENLANNKAIVFSQFKGMLHLIAAELQKLNIPFYQFDGDTKLSERQRLVSAFQADGDTARVFLISLKAGNAGITLTAADYVFLVDPWWNTAVQDQAIDRTHRIGQTKTVFAYKMICKNSIEEKIMLLQLDKKALSDDLVSAEENFVKSMSMEDVKYIFG